MKYYEKNPVLRADLEYIKENFDFSPFEGKIVLVSGASGFLGSIIVKSLLFACKNVKILALIRNFEKAERIFGAPADIRLKFLVQDILEPVKTDEKADFIIHAAGETSSANFFNRPAHTALTNLKGTENILEYAVKSGTEGMVYLSSLEVYGAHSGGKLTESAFSTVDPMNPRSSYPESKRMCENLCAAYAKEFNLRVMSARLTQTFGAGINYDDSRVIMQFVRSVIEEKPIILHTDGLSAKNYCYSADAVLAILTILTKGKAANAYNAANPETFASIKEIAQMLTKMFPKTKLKFEKNDGSIYFPECVMDLDVKKLEALGWKAQIPLEEMLKRTIKYFQEGKNEH